MNRNTALKRDGDVVTFDRELTVTTVEMFLSCHNEPGVQNKCHNPATVGGELITHRSCGAGARSYSGAASSARSRHTMGSCGREAVGGSHEMASSRSLALGGAGRDARRFKRPAQVVKRAAFVLHEAFSVRGERAQ